MYDKSECSPLGVENENTCLSNHLLIKIANNINKLNRCSAINCDLSHDKLYTEVCDRMKIISECKKESCWVKSLDVMNGLSSKDKIHFNESFKPFTPPGWISNPTMWLNTRDIDDVLNRYQKKYPSFKYFGAIPIDFSKKRRGTCMVSDLCKLNIKKLLKEKYKSVGIVFNTDPHNKEGEHWFSMYIDLIGINRSKPTIYYYDSAKYPISNEIKLLIKNIKKQFKKIGNIRNKSSRLRRRSGGGCSSNIDFLFNDMQHQFGDTECGIYSIHFIVQMLKGVDFHNYINKNINDKEIQKFRKVFFIDSNN